MTITANPPAENTDPWYAARTTFDTQVKATANDAETAAAAASGAAGSAQTDATAALSAASAAQTTANGKASPADVAAAVAPKANTTDVTAGLATKVNVADVAALNVTGWVRGVWLTSTGNVPGGTPVNTLVIRSAA